MGGNETGQDLFPDRSPDTKRDKEWHKEMGLAIMHRLLTGDQYLSQYAKQEAFEYFEGTQDLGRLQHMSIAAGEGAKLQNGTGQANNLTPSGVDAPTDNCDTGTVPAIYMNFNKLRTRYKVLEGDLIQQGFEIVVKTINREGRKLRGKIRNQYHSDMRVNQVMRPIQEETGVNLGVQDQIMPGVPFPDSEQGLDRFMEQHYQTPEEAVVKIVLDYWREYYDWKIQRLDCFRDMIVTGYCHATAHIRNGYPQPQHIDCRMVVWDNYTDDDFLTNAQYLGYVEYSGIADIAERDNISKKQLKELHNKQGTADAIGWTGIPIQFAGGNIDAFSPFKGKGSDLHSMRFTAYWIDQKETSLYISTYQGNETVLTPDEYDRMMEAKATNPTPPAAEEAPKEQEWKKETRYRQIVRYVVIVGGDIVADWGEDENMIRSIDNPTVAKFPVVSLVPYNVNGIGVSFIRELMPLQDLKNMLFWKVQHEIAKAGGKGIAIDVSKIPREWGINNAQQLLYHVKALGVTVYNGGEMGIDGGKPFETWDNSLSQSVGQYLEISRYLDSEMDDISGINQARQGKVQGANQLASVTAMSQQQSNLTTAGLFFRFFRFEEKMFELLTELFKICWANHPELYKPILDSYGKGHLAAQANCHEMDYRTIVNPLPMSKETLQQAALSAVQQGSLLMHEYLILMKMAQTDVSQAIDHFITKQTKQQEAQAQQAAQVQEQQLMAQQQMAQQNDEMNSRLKEMELQFKAAIEQQKIEAADTINQRDNDTKQRISAEQLKMKLFELIMSEEEAEKDRKSAKIAALQKQTATPTT